MLPAGITFGELLKSKQKNLFFFGLSLYQPTIPDSQNQKIIFHSLSISCRIWIQVMRPFWPGVCGMLNFLDKKGGRREDRDTKETIDLRPQYSMGCGYI